MTNAQEWAMGIMLLTIMIILVVTLFVTTKRFDSMDTKIFEVKEAIMEHNTKGVDKDLKFFSMPDKRPAGHR
jgi:uncharacterized membrane protein YvbJ